VADLRGLVRDPPADPAAGVVPRAGAAGELGGPLAVGTSVIEVLAGVQLSMDWRNALQLIARG